MKQVLLSLCTKRKTGSKQLVRWLNKFGHSISYDEVSYLETSLANQQAEQQIHKSFVPAIIKPSRFVIFVWDNNDINPETLTGISMHCTNGILIQLAAESHRNNDWIIPRNPTPSPTVRKRSFKAMFNAIDLLVSKRRECPDTINIELQAARNSEGEQASKNTDFMWVLLKHQAARRVIGKRFGDAGLRNIVIEANLLGEASVNKFLHGKHYNNCMRIYKYLFDALTRLKIDRFEDWMAKEEEFQSLQLFASSNELEHFIDDISSKNFHELLMKHDNILELFNRYENHLSDHTAAGPMATFWQSFLEMINILFCFIRSLRIGDWHLHLESTRKMLPWMFAYDCPNYSRHLT
eukprot:gene13591-14999_t